jgi:hypothetical protein
MPAMIYWQPQLQTSVLNISHQWGCNHLKVSQVPNVKIYYHNLALYCKTDTKKAQKPFNILLYIVRYISNIKMIYRGSMVETCYSMYLYLRISFIHVKTFSKAPFLQIVFRWRLTGVHNDGILLKYRKQFTVSTIV